MYISQVIYIKTTDETEEMHNAQSNEEKRFHDNKKPRNLQKMKKHKKTTVMEGSIILQAGR
jgi:hypothetical protein